MATDMSIGERLRFFREGRGLKQYQVAMQAGIDVNYVGMIERGDRTPSVKVLCTLADVLGVSIAALRGEPSVQPRGVGHPAIPAIYDALLGIGGKDEDEVDPVLLEDRVGEAWRTWQTSKTENYSLTGAVLPALVRAADRARTAMASADPELRRKAGQAACCSFMLASGFARQIGRSEVAVLAAHRATREAEDAEDPVLLGAVKWRLGGQLVHDCQLDGAEEVARTTIERLRPLADESNKSALAIYGEMHLLAAVAVVRQGDLYQARRYIEAARSIADVTGETNAFWTCFGPTNVLCYAVAVEAEGGEPHKGVEIADHIADDKVVGLPSVGRRARHFMVMSHLYDLILDDAGVLVHLLRAEREAPEEIKYNVMAQETTRHLLKRARSSYRSDVVALAQRIGVIN